MALSLTSTTSYTALVVLLLLAGIGGSAVFPAAQTAVLHGVPDDTLGRATGLTAVVREFGGVLGIAAVSFAFAATAGYNSRDEVIDGIQVVIGLCAALALVAALIGTTTRLQRRSRPARETSHPATSR